MQERATMLYGNVYIKGYTIQLAVFMVNDSTVNNSAFFKDYLDVVPIILDPRHIYILP